MGRWIYPFCLGIVWLTVAVTTIGIEAWYGPTPKPAHIADQQSLKMGMPTSPLRECGTPCVINFSPGGYMTDFEIASIIINYWPDQMLLINGPCYSACTLLADLSFDKICITDNAEFYYHMATASLHWDFIPYGHSKYVLAWVAARGGFPPTVGGRTLRMDREEAGKHWRPCTEAELVRARAKNFPELQTLTRSDVSLALLANHNAETFYWETELAAGSYSYIHAANSVIFRCGPCAPIDITFTGAIQVYIAP